MTNNEEEYKALIYGLELASKLGIHNFKVFYDSNLVSRHVNGFFEAKDKRMKNYCDKVTKLVEHFRMIDIQTIRRELNAQVDGLAKGATYGEYLKKKEIITDVDCLMDVNMIEAQEEGETNSMK